MPPAAAISRGFPPTMRDTQSGISAAVSATAATLTCSSGDRPKLRTRVAISASSASVACGGSPSATMSACSAASRTMPGFEAATKIGGGSPRPRTARIVSATRRSRSAGEPKCPPSASASCSAPGRPPPSPNSNRPSLSNCKLRVSQATSSGDRLGALST
jgi:hypothetical protein